MKKVFLTVTILFLSVSVGTVLAQETQLPGPGFAPDSPLYFLERIFEAIGTFFTFGDLKKAERYAFLASERVAEVEAVVEKGRPEAAQIALKRYEDQLNRALARAERAKTKGQNIAQVAEKVAEATGKHLTVLEGVLEKVSEVAKEAITRAKEVSMTGQKNALRALARENPERAIEINLKAIEGRLNRAKVKADEGETEEAEKALKEFENLNQFGQEISQIAQGLGKDTTNAEQLVGKATSIHLEILAEVYEKVPEQAKAAIEKAMEASVKGHERAVEALIKKEALDEVPAEPPLPESIPEEIRKRIKEKIEEAKPEIEEPEIPETPETPETPEIPERPRP
jgi:tetratricopeptide (TPR) repeat protein